MKKIVSVLLMLLLSLSLVIANTPAIATHNSTPMSSHEMSSIVGGGYCTCGCVNFWIISVCVCIIDPTGWFCE